MISVYLLCGSRFKNEGEAELSPAGTFCELLHPEELII